MEELIRLDGKNSEFPIDARELWERIEVKTRFDIWLTRRIEEFGFIAGQDFCTILSKSRGGRPATEYYIKAVQSWIDCGFDYHEIKSMFEAKALPGGRVALLS